MVLYLVLGGSLPLANLSKDLLRGNDMRKKTRLWDVRRRQLSR